MDRLNFILILQFLFGISLAQEKLSYPVTRQGENTEDYFGTVIHDPYRWLEDDRSSETATWVEQQNLITQTYLNQISQRSEIRKRLTRLWNYNRQSAPYKKGDYFFCNKNNGLQNQSVLYMLKNLEDEGEVLLDPNTLSTDGTISISGTSISTDGKTLAYGLSKAGSDWIEIHFRDVKSKKDLPDVLKWVKFSGMSWKDNGIFYSSYDEPDGSFLSKKNQNHKVYFHKLGTDQQSDDLIIEDKLNPNYNFGASVSNDGNYLLISISESTSGEKMLLKDLRNKTSAFLSISDNFDFDYHIIGNIGSTFYMLTNNRAPKYKIVAFDAATPEQTSWHTVVPETSDLLEGARLCNNRIIVNYLQNVTSKLKCFNLNGKFETEIKLPGLCRLNAFYSEIDNNFATYSIVSFTTPEQIWLLDSKTWKSQLIFKPKSDFKSENFVTKQVFFNSKDGTRIPMFITHKKGLKPDVNTPCFVYGYGGFNISLAPEFRTDRAVFLEAGGIYCVPNLRGGGEYGEDWHKAGTKKNKQNVFDDFISACDWLVSKKYTAYNKIAIHGRSNGGLLVGAVMTQRPDICKVALPAVGVLDMLRFHVFTIGRAWAVDYGCSENKEEFECLVKYSPLQNVEEKQYPSTMILTADHDDRVVPAHSFKFAATLQKKNKSTNPMLIRVDANAGHGSGKPTSKLIDEFTDMWGFVFYNLGMDFKTY